MKITVVGLGYIGLPTASMFAKAGATVCGVDKNPKIIESLEKGNILIEEKGLSELVQEMVKMKRLTASTQIMESDAFIIAVPTPIKPDKTSDLTFVREATASLIPHVKKGDIVILESTSPVGTVDNVMLPILAKSGLDPLKDIYLGHSPERVIPGKILQELVENDRIVGGVTPEASQKIADLYRMFVKGNILLTDSRTAELCKLSENTYRDVNIAFANELAIIAENMGVDVWEVIRLCNHHPRVNIHTPGPGVGGHCIAVDPWFIVENQPENAKIITLSRKTNDRMPVRVSDIIEKSLKGINNPTVTVLGVSYKPDVDDLRESPIIYLIQNLLKKGINVNVCDPHVYMKANIKGIEKIYGDPYEAAKDSHLLVLGVNHSVFKEINPDKMKMLMKRPNLYDTRNFFDYRAFEDAGFTVERLGASSLLNTLFENNPI